MNILNIPINQLKFENIVSFCEEKLIEGIQLEYKKEFPKKGLSKHFASMSNTRGGLIIIGIEEDEKIGIPRSWNGIKNEGKLIDRVHQYAAQVEPIPKYEVFCTDEKDGNVFVLIRIFEGDSTPYYVQNDANIWIRTGNITNPIDIASIDALELLFRKNEKAELARLLYINQAENIYRAALDRGEKERKQIIANESRKFEIDQKRSGITEPDFSKFSPSCIQSILGTDTSMCTILLQPFYPRKAYIKPFDLKNEIQKFKVSNRNTDIPNNNQETTPEGILHFNYVKSTGRIQCEQFFCNGLIFGTDDILRTNPDGFKFINLSTISEMLYAYLILTQKFHTFLGYQGKIYGHLKIENLFDTYVYQLIPRKYAHFNSDPKAILLPEYKWDLEIDTNILNNHDTLLDFFIDTMNYIHVSFNFAPLKEEYYKELLKENNWIE